MMKISIHENLSSFDRTMRIVIGVGLCMSILVMPYQAAWISALAFAAMYPLLSGLTAIDPFLALAENIALKPVEIRKAAPTTTGTI